MISKSEALLVPNIVYIRDVESQSECCICIYSSFSLSHTHNRYILRNNQKLSHSQQKCLTHAIKYLH